MISLITNSSPEVFNDCIMQTKSTKKRRRVHFGSEEEKVICTVENASDMSDSQRNKIWYPVSELEMMRTELRSFVRTMRVKRRKMGESRSSPSSTNIFPEQEVECTPSSTSSSANGEDDKPCHRGLEFRMSSRRQRSKIMAIGGVLEAQRILKANGEIDASVFGPVSDRYDDATKLAIISSKFSFLARKIAVQTGVEDLKDAYSVEEEAKEEPCTRCHRRWSAPPTVVEPSSTKSRESFPSLSSNSSSRTKLTTISDGTMYLSL